MHRPIYSLNMLEFSPKVKMLRWMLNKDLFVLFDGGDFLTIEYDSETRVYLFPLSLFRMFSHTHIVREEGVPIFRAFNLLWREIGEDWGSGYTYARPAHWFNLGVIISVRSKAWIRRIRFRLMKWTLGLTSPQVQAWLAEHDGEIWI